MSDQPATKRSSAPMLPSGKTSITAHTVTSVQVNLGAGEMNALCNILANGGMTLSDYERTVRDDFLAVMDAVREEMYH